MRHHDKTIPSLSLDTTLGAALLLAGLFIACGKSKIASPAHPDGATLDASADAAAAEPGPEVATPAEAGRNDDGSPQDGSDLAEADGLGTVDSERGHDGGGDGVTGGKPDAYVAPAIPADEASCLAATGVPACGPAGPRATVHASGSTQLLSVAVSAGPCSGSSCSLGCSALVVYGGGSASVGSTCDLLIRHLDGAQQTVRLTVVANPSPTYACCGYPLAPNQGRWVAVNPRLLSPADIILASPIDGGAVDAR